jgi:hypothetical protein
MKRAAGDQNTSCAQDLDLRSKQTQLENLKDALQLNEEALREE